MDPNTDPTIAVLAILQQAIGNLITTSEPQVLRIARSVLSSMIVVHLARFGLDWLMGEAGNKFQQLTDLVLWLSIAVFVLTFYNVPIPGLGLSASAVIPASAAFIAAIFESRALAESVRAFDDLYARFSIWSIGSVTDVALFTVLSVVIACCKACLVLVNAYSLIASGICQVLGPLFIALGTVPTWDWLTKSWLRAYMSYSFLQAVAAAYIMIGGHMVTTFVNQGLPATISQDLWAGYLIQALVVLFIFCAGTISVPFLSNSLFSGFAAHGPNVGPAISGAVSRVSSAVGIGR